MITALFLQTPILLKSMQCIDNKISERGKYVHLKESSVDKPAVCSSFFLIPRSVLVIQAILHQDFRISHSFTPSLKESKPEDHILMGEGAIHLILFPQRALHNHCGTEYEVLLKDYLHTTRGGDNLGLPYLKGVLIHERVA